ncbi:MAG: helix-turn-helix domain-containing protein [Methylorubrum populi]
MSEAMDRQALDALHLPAALRLVAEAAGLEAAVKLAWTRGGARLYVPRKVPVDHWLLRVVGSKGVEALQRRYVCKTIPLPQGPAGKLQRAWLAASHALDEGASVAGAARAAGLSERSVYNLRRRLRSGLKLCPSPASRLGAGPVDYGEASPLDPFMEAAA